MAAEHATPETMAFMIRHSSGIICVPMEEERLLRLELPQMVGANNDSYRTAFTVSVDYRHGTSTGVSAADRAATIAALANPQTVATDFARPGHIFPLRPRRGGVLVRAGHTEAAVDLCVLAGLRPAGVLCELMNDDGTMARRAQCESFARRTQPGDRHDRGPDPLPAAQRTLGGPDRRPAGTDRIRRVSPVCLRGSRQPRDPPGAGARPPGRPGAAAGARSRGRHLARCPWRLRRWPDVDAAPGPGAGRGGAQRRGDHPAGSRTGL